MSHTYREGTLSVIIVNWNSRDDLAKCLRSLRLQEVARLEIIVVDNGSTDGSVDMVRADFPECLVLNNSDNLGFAEACNRGIQMSTGQWIAMLNNDAVAEPQWASALLDAASRAPDDCGMLQSLLLYQDRINTINSAGIELAYSGGGRDRKEGKHYDPSLESADEAIFCPTAGAAAYRRTMIESIRLSSGYFDSSHFLYYEDMDLGWRARLAGWSAIYVPQSIVHHRWHGSSNRHGKSRLLVLANTNRIRMLLKNASAVFIVATMPRTLKELAQIIYHGGPQAIITLATAIVQSAKARREVGALLQCSRRQIERAFRARPLRG